MRWSVRGNDVLTVISTFDSCTFYFCHDPTSTNTVMEDSGVWPRLPRTGDPSTGIDRETYDDLVRYTKYASASYQTLCPRPLGNTLVGEASPLISSKLPR